MANPSPDSTCRSLTRGNSVFPFRVRAFDYFFVLHGTSFPLGAWGKSKLTWMWSLLLRFPHFTKVKMLAHC